MASGSEPDLRCGCSARRLLAVIGEIKGRKFLHVKSHRSGKTLSELKIHAGVVEILCMSCHRWTRVLVRRGEVERGNPPAIDG